MSEIDNNMQPGDYGWYDDVTRQTKRGMFALGVMVSQYEYMMSNVRMVIIQLFGLKGLSDMELINAIVLPMSSRFQIDLLKTMLLLQYPKCDREITDTCEALLKLNTLRNELIHSTYAIGGPSGFMRLGSKNKKGTRAIIMVDHSPEDFWSACDAFGVMKAQLLSMALEIKDGRPPFVETESKPTKRKPPPPDP